MAFPTPMILVKHAGDSGVSLPEIMSGARRSDSAGPRLAHAAGDRYRRSSSIDEAASGRHARATRPSGPRVLDKGIAMFRKVMFIAAACGIVLATTACNTVKGVGRDIESVGKAGERAM